MRSIRIRCPEARCQAVLSVPQRLAGQQVRCGCCGRVFRVPQVPARGRRRRDTRAA